MSKRREPAPAAWARQPAETPKSYFAFSEYRDLGPLRSFKKLRVKLGSKTSRHHLRWSSEHHWVDRANAFDHAQDTIKLDAYAVQHKRLAVLRAKAAVVVQREALKAIIGDKKKRAEKPGAIRNLHKIARTDLGDKGTAARVKSWSVLLDLADVATSIGAKNDSEGEQIDVGAIFLSELQALTEYLTQPEARRFWGLVDVALTRRDDEAKPDEERLDEDPAAATPDAVDASDGETRGAD